jgi:hypothetical protein
VEACDRINEGWHGLNSPFNPNFGPSDLQIFEVAEGVVAPHWKALDAAEALLEDGRARPGHSICGTGSSPVPRLRRNLLIR